VDNKNIQLLKLLAQLRDHIDIHRIIGLNVSALRTTAIGEPLLGYLQRSAHESLAMCLCKIFEAQSVMTSTQFLELSNRSRRHSYRRYRSATLRPSARNMGTKILPLTRRRLT